MLFGIKKKNLSIKLPNKKTSVLLGTIPFLICIILYFYVAHTRHKKNPQDKVVPTLSQMKEGIKRAAFEKDRKGQYRLWVDTLVSTRRFVIAVAIIFGGVIIGLHMGVFPLFEALFLRFVLFFDKIPALAVLPILFIIFGLGEVSKIALMVIGVLPTITLDTYLRAKRVQREQLLKGFTLGASSLEVAYRIVLRQIFPKVLDTIRLNFKSVWLFLIAGESLAATVGLGYRIFVMRRYIAMDIIIPYVLWISILAFIADYIVQRFIRWRYPWLDHE
ncbi:MAG: ABC transporter permease [Candidatus Poribacteria bacterium]